MVATPASRQVQLILLVCCTLLLLVAPCPAADVVTARSVAWQQVEQTPSFTLAVERRQYTALDVGGRVVLAVQAGRGKKCDAMTAKWSITHDNAKVLGGDAALAQGMAVIDFDLAALKPGKYRVDAEQLDGDKSVAKKSSEFEVLPTPAVDTKGRIPLILPRGVEAGDGVVPLTFGVPMPKGALTDVSKVRVVDGAGKVVPAQFTVRGKWGYAEKSSVRWLGVDIQSGEAPAWWPERKATPYFLEFGGEPGPAAQGQPLRVQRAGQDLRVDTGAVAFTVRQHGFNLVDDVRVAGNPVLSAGAGPAFGPYIVDHEGATYRAANDRAVALTIEEEGPLRVVIRAEGWYVKDGTDGSKASFTLPTDRISKFITRIEAYRGQSTIRVQHTWIITYDSFTVRLRDVGFALPVRAGGEVEFGVEGGAPVRSAVGKEGVYLIQHRHNRFAVETGAGKTVGEGARSDGSMRLSLAGDAAVGLALRDVWQRFPKEIEVLPDQLRLHIWPAHGRTDPAIDPYARNRYHQLWFAHQGKELDLNFPWDTLFAVMKYTDNPSTGIYKPGGTAMGGVHASAMGASITSDFQICFAAGGQRDQQLKQAARAFNRRPVAAAHPDWIARSQALGPVHPYDPANFGTLEDAASRILRAYQKLQDDTEQFGMFLYRVWHHNSYRGEGFWDPYRLYSAGHHYEPYMPWLYYARSGNPEYHDYGDCTSRTVTDLGLIHYDDPAYEHREFWSRQARLLGSTRHTNGFVMWGGDHAVLGHLTTYNGHLLAHYLTGDLRYREILVNEWQHSLLDDRANPELSKASRLGAGRDNNNSLGELIDLYQLTWDPRLLAYIEPCTERLLDAMKVWGMPVQNVMWFSGDPRVKNNLLEGLEARLKDKTADLHGVFTGHCPAGMYALGSLLEPGKGFANEALVLSAMAQLTVKAEKLEKQEPGGVALCSVPDDLLYLPRIMAAIASERQGGTLGNVVSTQVLPTGGSGIDANFTRVVALEEKDGPFTIEIKGAIRAPGIPLQVYAPDGSLVLETTVPEGLGEAYTIPADGKTGEYVIFVKPRDHPRDTVMSPITTLPKEVYVLGYWSQATPTRLFTKLPSGEDGKVIVTPHKTSGVILAADMQTTLASTAKGDQLEAVVPPEGVWVNLRAVYINMPKDRRLIAAVDPDHFFAPSQKSLAVKPKP